MHSPHVTKAYDLPHVTLKDRPSSADLCNGFVLLHQTQALAWSNLAVC